MNTCKNCVHFDNRSNQKLSPSIPKTEQIGLCKKVCSDKLLHCNAIYTPAPNMSMMVGESFGCVHHKVNTDLN